MHTMDELMKYSAMIKAEALKLGFDACGIARATYLNEDSVHLKNWLREKFHGGMTYMENNLDKRLNPIKLVEGAQSVISVLLNYFPAGTQSDAQAPVISTYAYGEDYHQAIKKKLKQLLHFIDQEINPVKGRSFVDSAPVLDRAWAARAGLGWIGKNSNLISLAHGSFVFIGSLIVDIPLQYDNPINDYCGSCNRCIRACPTSAIVNDKVIDARRCISYLTIENKDDIPEKFKNNFQNRVFGCDICQDVCPWNRKSRPHQVKEFDPLPGLLEMTRKDWFELSEQQYNKLFIKSAVKRAKFTGICRNLAFIARENDPAL
jgi:epoxyqueuosine reductase